MFCHFTFLCGAAPIARRITYSEGSHSPSRKPFFISPERPVMRIELCFTCLGFSLLPAGDGWISWFCEPDILRLFRNSLNNSYTTCQSNRSCASELTFISRCSSYTELCFFMWETILLTSCRTWFVHCIVLILEINQSDRNSWYIMHSVLILCLVERGTIGDI